MPGWFIPRDPAEHSEDAVNLEDIAPGLYALEQALKYGKLQRRAFKSTHSRLL